MSRFCIYLVLLVLPARLYASTFTVVSAADNGPGTLRQAIIDAAINGTTTTDTIIFQIADVTRVGRTIVIQSELPVLSSNLIIDGSTQAGTAIGMSQAKITVEQKNPVTNSGFRFLRIYNAVNVQVYGLFLYNTWWDYPYGSLRPPIIAVDLHAARDVVFGSPGKGNYIRGTRYGFYSQPTNVADSSSGLTIQSNLAGIDETGGITSSYPYNAVLYSLSYPFLLKYVNNIKVGGETKTEGNTINGNTNDILGTSGNGNGFVNIENNNFNLTVTGQLDLDGSSGNQNVFTIGSSSGQSDYVVNFKNNSLNGNLYIRALTKFFTVQGNRIFVPYYISSNDIRLQISFCTGGGIIGGTGPGQPNEIFTNNWSGQNYYAVSSPGSRCAINVSGSDPVTISRNSIYNTTYFASAIHGPVTPYVRIDSTGVNFVRGKATPNTTVEVFVDDPWLACEGKDYLGSTTAAADSNWQFTGLFDTVVVATATNSQNITSRFSSPELITTNVKVQGATCGKNNGSITGLRAIGYDRVEWRHLWKPTTNTDSVIANDFDAYNLPPGEYYFHAWLGKSCRSYYARYTIDGIQAPALDASTKQLVHPSCGQNTGSIKNIGVTSYNYSTFSWKNNAGIIFPAVRVGNTLQLLNAPPGNYKLVIRDTAGGCSDSTEWISLVNQSGPLLNTDNLVVTHASCSLPNGAVQGIQVQNAVAPLYYRWEDSTGNVVSNNINLQNIKGGRYRLKFKDGGGCDTLLSPFIIVQNNGVIKLDSSTKVLKIAGCGLADGAITGLLITGADIFQWKNQAGSTVGSNRDLLNVPGGTYSITTSNSFACSLTVAFVIPNAAFQPINVVSSRLTPGSCDINNGSIEVIQFSKDPSSYQMAWKDSATGISYTGMVLNNLSAGTYQLVAEDQYHCTQKIFSATINQLGKPVIASTNVQVNGDTCDRGIGSIKGLTASAGSGGPYRWTWYDATGATVNSSGLTSGNYHAVVTDVAGCAVNSTSFAVADFDVSLVDPGSSDQHILRGSNTIVRVQNPQSYNYWLFDTVPAITAVQASIIGSFAIGPVWYEKTYYLQAINGTCKSNLVPVQIKLFDETTVTVPNAFSPNNDGLNDVWHIRLEGIFQLEYLIVYDRYGCEVYRAKNLNTSWDGKYNNNPLAPGTYYFILRGKGGFGEKILRTGPVTIIR